MNDVSTDVAVEDEARRRAERIRSGMRVLAEWQADVIAAHQARDWIALGYTGWDAYLDGEFGEHRLRLPSQQRREIVASMSEAGMSTRAIASAAGVTHPTILSDLRAGGRDLPPEMPGEAPEPAPTPPPMTPVSGLDGKTYAQPARTAPRPRPALPQQFRALASELTRITTRIERLTEDDRYRSNRGTIARDCLPEVRRAASVIHGLLADLEGVSDGA